MDIKVLTLFPNMIENLISESVIARGIKKNLFSIEAINFRNYSEDKHLRVDDVPYSGSSGMLIKIDPICKALEAIEKQVGIKPKVIYMSPKGRRLNQDIVNEYVSEKNIVVLCGHYEGIDQRVIDTLVDDEISIGDYVLTGGELPAMVFIDSLVRHIPGVIACDSLKEESFTNGLLEYPQYTRPEVFMGSKVPAVLLSGNHKNIEEWKKEQSLYVTYNKRPDIIKKLISEKILEQEYIDKIVLKYKNEKEGGTI